MTPASALERASRFRGNVCLDNVPKRFSVQSTGLTLVHLLTLHRSGRGWQRTPTYLFRSERSRAGSAESGQVNLPKQAHPPLRDRVPDIQNMRFAPVPDIVHQIGVQCCSSNFYISLLPIYPRIGYNKPGNNKHDYFSF